MNDSTNNNNPSRRKFLSLGLLAGAGLITTSASAQSLSESGETVKMLTQDGKLVEVDKALIVKSSSKKQASKKDVLGWINPTE
ncbi:MAG: hypothetical protein ABJB16_16430 [Saprospiraceae bacterium]